MKKLSLLFALLLCLSACSNKESNLTITGKVKDLKKGTLYLQKIEDTALITLDSIVVQGDPNFVFETSIESPQVLYLYLDKVDGTQYNDRILFFAEPGEMTLTTSLQNFETDAVFAGSANQEKLEEFQKMMARFNSQNLDLLKENLEAQQQRDTALMTAAEEKSDNLLKRRYLYTVNYALNNKDLEIAPYLAVSEVYDANIKYLDTIYNSLTPKVKDSKYGKTLEEFLKERRELEEDSLAESEG